MRAWLTSIASVTLALVSARTQGEEQSEKPLAEQLPRIAALAPSDAAKSFQVERGFQMQLVASEPHVTDPVDAAFDEDGRLWVAEMLGYPYPQKDAELFGRVRILEDRDDDGIYESSRIFADKLYWPTGIALYKGGCFVCAAPDLLYLNDTDGDGAADVREVVFTGFGRENVQALFNNPKWTLDGRIAIATSLNGGTITRPNEETPNISARGADFVFNPATREAKAISGTAQFGNSFSSAYDRFICSNSNHAVHVVLDRRYLERNPYLSGGNVLAYIPDDGGAAPVFRVSKPEPWRVVRTARRVASGQSFAATELVVTGFFTSASGITIYRGDAYPPEFAENLFVGDVGGNLIHRKKLIPDSATFTATRLDKGVEFVTSTDNWFRPVNFVNAPDGTLHVLDMYRETIEHPWSIPEDIKSHLDLESGRDRGRIYRLAPPRFTRRATPKLSQASAQDLISLLGHPNAWHRETAQRLLIERADNSTARTMRAALASSKNQYQWLHGLGTLKALNELEDDDVGRGLSSSFPRVREQAVRWSEGRLNDSDALFLAVTQLADDPDFRVRWQVALSLGESSRKERASTLVALAKRDGADSWMRLAILSSSGDAALSMLEGALASESKELDSYVDELARIVGGRFHEPEVNAFLSMLAQADLSEPKRLSLAAGFCDGLRLSRTTLDHAAFQSPDGKQFRDWLPNAATKVVDDVDAQDRLTTIRLLRHLPTESIQDLLRELLEPRFPHDVQFAALSVLTERTDEAVAKVMLDVWPSAAPALRSEMLEAMLSTNDRQKALLDAVQAGTIPASQLSPQARQRLEKSKDPGVVKLAAELLGKMSTNRKELFETYKQALASTAGTENGEKAFLRECATCHRLGAAGHAVGPDLATITNRSAEQLLQHILDPNLEVLPAYQEYAVVLTDGRTISGIITAETATNLTLKRAEGVTQVVARSEIDEVHGSGRSLMPEGIEQKINPREMAALIEFLLTQKPASAATQPK